VNVDKAEDVLIHQKVLAEAKDPDRRPAFAVRFLRLEEVNVAETTNSDAHEEGADTGEALSTRYSCAVLVWCFSSLSDLDKQVLCCFRPTFTSNTA